MADFALQSSDPFGLGSITSGPILVTNISGGPRRENVEVLGGDARYISSAVVPMRPIEEWTVNYELLDTAAFTVAMGVAVNTDYLITAASANCTSESYPTVTLTGIKPSAANKIKPYPYAVTFALAGGFGVVEKWGSTAALDYISTTCSIALQQAEAMEETSGDFLIAGIYQYGFKQDCSAEAYGAITLPAGGIITAEDVKEGRDGWKTYSKSWWKYLDAH